MSVSSSIVCLAKGGSKEIVIGTAEILQNALETIQKVGTPKEIVSAAFLLDAVNRGIKRVIVEELCSDCDRQGFCRIEN